MTELTLCAWCEYVKCKCPASHPDTIFVFGSNLAGRHGAGAALYALQNKGAVYGYGHGLMGKSYALPTKDYEIQTLGLHWIEYYAQQFVYFAQQNPDLTFALTAVGCGLAGYTPDQIAPFFRNAPDNVLMNVLFDDALDEKVSY